MTSDEGDYGEDELRDARALAGALDHGSMPDRAVADAIDAAELVALLKAPLLEGTRAEAILAGTERRIAAARRRARRRLTWIGSAAGALALAAAALLMVRVQREPSRAPELHGEAPVASTPEPSAAVRSPAAPAAGHVGRLRAAQIAWLTEPSPDAAATLERELAAYRSEQLAMLERRYGP